MREILHNSAALVHYLQKERGLVAGYLKSEGNLFENPLRDHFIRCDDILRYYLSNDIESDIESGGESGRESDGHEPPVVFVRSCEELTGWRDSIMALEVAGHRALDFYTYKLINPLIQNMVEVLLHNGERSSVSAASVSGSPVLRGGGRERVAGNVYNAFMQWKENIGLERALGVRALIIKEGEDLGEGSVGGFVYDEFVERLTLLANHAESNKATCFLLADSRQRILLEELCERHHTVIDDWHAIIKSGDIFPSHLLEGLTAERWFDLIDEKMDVLHIYEKKFIDLICDSSASADKKNNNDSQVCDFAVSLEGRLDFLRSLPLFGDICDDDLRSILSCAIIRRYPKGRMLVAAESEPRRFHLILDGWVKLHSLSSEGMDIVLQMLNAGDAIMEQSVLLNAPYPASATAVQDVELLCLPASHINRCIGEHPQFASNFLRVMGSRLQNFIWHVETIRSHTAEQRLGWFLLRLLLESKYDTRHIRLPYNKNILASYLDMQPETLSRVLRKFKARGFEVNNDTIIVPEFSMLCGFCDFEISSMCHHRGSS